MEYNYKKDYTEIGIRVIYSKIAHQKRTLSFAAQPYELMMDPELNNKPEVFLIRGRVETGERLILGFHDFTFEMTKDLHSRLGKLYELLREEYRNTILKKT